MIADSCRLTGAARRCRSFAFSTENHLNTCEDSGGTVHGEQSDTLMPLLSAVGQHIAIEAASFQWLPGERILAHLDDIYMITMPERVGAVHAIVEDNCAFEPKSGSTVARRRCGVQANNLKLVIFLSASHSSRTPELSCGVCLAYLLISKG